MEGNPMPRLAANLTMLFNELDFLDRFEAAADAGFKGVEYLFPYAHPKEQLAERLAMNGLTQVLHNLPAGDWAKGERGIACLPDRVAEFQAGVGRAIEYAKALGCRQVNCLAGIPPPHIDPARIRATFVDNLRFAAEKLGAAGIRLMIEPCNTRDIPGFFLNRSRQAIGIIDDVGSDNLWLQYDIYHMQIMEGDLAPTIERLLPRIAHLQLADNPGRHEPGTGEIGYPYLLEFIDKLGYRGWIGCEYKPAGTTSEGLGWAGRYLQARGAAWARLDLLDRAF
jgi:hydroxypyruvate isomerase